MAKRRIDVPEQLARGGLVESAGPLPAAEVVRPWQVLLVNYRWRTQRIDQPRRWRRERDKTHSEARIVHRELPAVGILEADAQRVQADGCQGSCGFDARAIRCNARGKG